MAGKSPEMLFLPQTLQVWGVWPSESLPSSAVLKMPLCRAAPGARLFQSNREFYHINPNVLSRNYVLKVSWFGFKLSNSWFCQLRFLTGSPQNSAVRSHLKVWERARKRIKHYPKIIWAGKELQNPTWDTSPPWH